MLALALALHFADPAPLDTAYIAVTLSGATAGVTTRYRFRTRSDAAEFFVMRVPGQEIRFRSTETLASLDHLPGAYRIGVAPAGDGVAWVAIEYDVTGSLTRIPIPVPSNPAHPQASSIRIRVSGLPVTAAFTHAFPRLVLDERSGEAWATPTSVPSFLRLPPATASWSVNRLAEALVVALVLLATGMWIVRRRPRPSAPPL